MKRLTLILMLAMTTIAATAQSGTDYSSIQEAVTSYVKAGDSNDVKTLKTLLSPAYRVAMNNASAGKVATFSREDYLTKIESKEWGGDTRALKIMSIDVYDGNTAQVKVSLDGKLKMRNYLSLVKSGDGWQIVQDLVFVGS